MTAQAASQAAGPTLAAVTIAADDPRAAIATFETLTGETAAVDETDYVLRLRNTSLRVTHAGSGRTGLRRLSLGVASVVERAAELERAGLAAEWSGEELVLSREMAGGIEVSFRELRPETGAIAPSAARVDHVALVVADLASAAERWSLIAGDTPDELGPHPLGNSVTARFLLADQMIELISPLPGADSAIRRRLDAAGDGPIALAVIPSDAGLARAQLEAAGHRLLDQPPHVFLHPGSTGGVLVQLTPRLGHAPSS